MPKVEAWECKHTGALFPLANENEYKKHTARAYRSVVAIRKMEKKKADFKEWLATEKAKCRSPKQIAQFLQDNFQVLYDNYNYPFKKKREKLSATVTINVNYREQCSNTHSCPQNGVMNWGSKADKPKGYPGLYGRINIDVTGQYSGFLGDVMSVANVCTGSGGHGNYDVTLWIDDWAGIKDEIEQQKAVYDAQHIVNILAGQKSPIFQPKWEDQ